VDGVGYTRSGIAALVAELRVLVCDNMDSMVIECELLDIVAQKGE
jgi:hypothetical protein